VKLTHARLLVHNFAESLRWYRDTLGFGVSLEVEDTYAEFDTGDAILAIYNRRLMEGVVGSQAQGRGRDEVVVTFAADGVDRTFQELRAKGVAFVTEPHDQPNWVLRVAHFRDPDGHLLEIYEPLRPEPS
jgi:lactoylglutathione lyase